MTTDEISIEQSPVASFRDQASELVGRFREVLTRTINECSPGVKRTRDAQDIFGVNMTLSWQIFRIVNATNDLIEVCPHIPSTGMMEKLVGALKKRSASKELLVELMELHANFEAFVERQAGDRACFDTIVSRLMDDQAQAQIELTLRRAAFECERHVWGLDMGVSVNAEILGPPDANSQLSIISLRQKMNLRRLGFDQTFVVDSRSFADACGASNDPMKVASFPLDKEAFAKFGIPIIPKYCSSTALPLRQVQAKGVVTTEWLGDSLGKSSRADFVMGEIHSFENHTLMLRTHRGAERINLNYFTIPTRIFFRDVLVHRSTFGRAQTKVTRWGHAMRPTVPLPAEELGFPKLTCHDSIMFMGSAADTAFIPEAPRYREALDFACGQMGWKLRDLDLYRMRVEFPLSHTMLAVTLEFELNPKWPARWLSSENTVADSPQVRVFPRTPEWESQTGG